MTTRVAPLAPELSGSVPRDVRLTGGGVALAVLALVLAVLSVAAAIGMSIAHVRAEDARQLRAREGAVATAEVVDVRIPRGDHPRHSITYQFEVDGRRYEGTATLGERDGRALAQGAALPIGFVRSRPAISWIPGHEPWGVAVWAIPLVSLGLLMAAGGVTWALRREWVLLSDGRLAQGRILSSEKVHRGAHGGGTKNRIRYEFVTMSGSRQTGIFEATKNPPAVGALMPVVYHRDRPSWNKAYPLQLVTPTRKPRN